MGEATGFLAKAQRREDFYFGSHAEHGNQKRFFILQMQEIFMSITLTETAAAEVKRVMESQKIEPSTMLRMSVAGGGCAGLQYGLGFDAEFDPKIDAKYENHGITLVARKKMALHLDGTVIDFQEGPMGRGFAIDNPSIPRTGGCPGCGHH
jgi:iron-sulfur cluster assembly protein